MTKEKDFYRELPAGYREDKVVDATDKKFMSVLYTALAVVMIITYVIVDFIDCGRITLFDAFFNRPTESDAITEWFISSVVVPAAVLIIGLVVYSCLRKAATALSCKIITGEKPIKQKTNGMEYYTVPGGVYIGKKSLLCGSLIPFTVFVIVLLLGVILLSGTSFAVVMKILFALHVGSSVSDFYVAGLLIFKYRKGCLMKDDGPKQVFYVRTETEE